MRFLPFLNRHSVTGKEEALEIFKRYIDNDELSDSSKKLAVEVSGDFYSFMFSFVREKMEAPEYKLLVQTTMNAMYVRMFGFLESEQEYFTKKDIYSKLYIQTIQFINSCIAENYNKLTFEEICLKISKFIDKTYFDLILKLKDYKEPYFYEYDYGTTTLYSKFLSKFTRSQMFQKIQNELQEHKQRMHKMGVGILFAASILFIMLDFLVASHIFSTCILIIFSLLLVANLVYTQYKTEKLLSFSQYSETDLARYLGVDILRLYISEDLIPIADPVQENIILPAISDARLKLVDEYGYVIPSIRVMDEPNLHKNQMSFYVREKEVYKFYFYPDKYIAKAPVLKLAGIDITKLKPALNITSDSKWYWVDKTAIQKISPEDYLSAKEYFINMVIDIALKFVDEIFSTSTAVSYEQLGKLQLADFDINVRNFCSYEDLRYVLVALLQEKISIKDVIFVLEKLHFYANKGYGIYETIDCLKRDLTFDKRV